MTPADLPLGALTHLNFAFAYVDPSSFEVVTMDPATEASLFQDANDLKVVNSDLKVFASLGGWVSHRPSMSPNRPYAYADRQLKTFSNNGTPTQPLFGEIASSESNRQKFADNAITSATSILPSGVAQALTDFRLFS